MSYTPTIIINKTDLENSNDILLRESYISKSQEVAKYLLNVSEFESMNFGELELVICQPELSGFNKKIRMKLDKLNIEYQISN